MRVKPLAAASLLLALPVFSQTNPTGAISGKVADQQGLAVPGVTVSVQSATLQGSRSTTTSANGDYIVPFLPPGDYTIAFELTGFATVRREERVSLNQTVPVNVTMSVTTVTETVTVTGQASGDFTQGSTVATNFKQELIEKLPTNRTFQAAAQLTPGVLATGPSGAVSISGAASFENLFMINGVVVQDNIRNTPFNLFIEDALQETSTRTAAVSAEFGRFSGGVVNAITKSGGNELSGSFRTTFDNNDWVSLTPFPNDKRVNDVIPTYEVTLGGPAVNDKVWFFGATRLRDLKEGLTTANPTTIPYTRERDEKRYEGKLTWSLNSSHTFKGSYSHISFTENGNSFGTILDLASLVNRQLPQDLVSANYTGIISPRFFVEAQYSLRKFTFENSGSQFTDLIKGTLLRDQSRGLARYNAPTFCGVCGPEKRDNQNVVLKASYFLSTRSTGSHNLGAGLDAFDDKRFSNNHQSGSDFRIHTTSAIIRGTDIFPVLDSRTFIRWTPIFAGTEGNRFRTYSAFLNDAWTLDKHWSFNLGVRYDKNAGKDSLGTVVVRDSALSPRLAATFDPRGDGKWTMNGSYAKYVAAIANGIGDSASAGGQPATIDFDYLGPEVNTGNPANPRTTEQALTTLWSWFNANGGTNRPTRGAPSIPGVTSRIDQTLASPNVQEFTLGFSRRLGTRGLFRVDGVYRRFSDFYSNRVDLSTGRVSDRFGRSFDLSIVDNTNVPRRRYKGINMQANYRFGQQLGLGGNYTLSETYGTFEGETGPSGPITATVGQYPEYFDRAWGSGAASGGGGPVGDLSADVRHRLRLWATWDAPLPEAAGRLSLGWLQFYQSGAPYGAAGLVDTRPYVTNPGYLTPPASVEYFFTNRDAFRMADLNRSDVSLNYSRRLGLRRAELFLRGVVLNVFNRQALTTFTDTDCGTQGCLDTTVLTNRNNASIARFNPFTQTPVEGTNWRKGAQFGQPASRYAYQTPRTYQIAVGFRF